MFNCDGADPPDFCGNPWCYIDTNLCPKNDNLCIAAGGVPGSHDSPYCRTRDFSSSDMTTQAWYSYATCGSINYYNVSGLTAGVEGHVLQIALIPAEPWVTETTSSGGERTFGGPSYDFFIEALGYINVPKANLNVALDFATPESRAKFPSSGYTACVHDVAVGNWDICVADLWLTPERNQLAHFLPTLRNDVFYLVVPRQIEEVTFTTRLLTPFKPFRADAWLGIAAFLCGMASLLWLLHLIENGWQGCDLSLVGWLRFQFAIVHDFLLGGGNVEVEKGPVYKLLHLSFAFFILVTLASYTASLASLLVVEAEAVGAVANIEEAIAQAWMFLTRRSLGRWQTLRGTSTSRVAEDMMHTPKMDPKVRHYAEDTANYAHDLEFFARQLGLALKMPTGVYPPYLPLDMEAMPDPGFLALFPSINLVPGNLPRPGSFL